MASETRDLSQRQQATRDIYERLFFEHSTSKSPELTAEGRTTFHRSEYHRVLGLRPEEFNRLSILESGCGPGSHSLILSNLAGPTGRLRSFDLSAVNIGKARQLLVSNGAPANYDFTVSDAETFTTDEPPFDVVCSHNWLHHSEDPLRSLFNILKPLKVGGMFYLCTYQARTFRALICEFVRRQSLTFDHEAFLRLVPFCFPGGFAQFNFYQIIHYENLIDDYLVPCVRFAHLDSLAPALERGGLTLRAMGVSSLLQKPDLFDVEDIPLKVGFTKVAHFDDFDTFAAAVGVPLFTESVPFLPAEAAHLSALVDQAFDSVDSAGMSQGRMLLAMALHGLRCQFATTAGNAPHRFAALERMLTAVISGNNGAYSLHAPDVWATKAHPLADEIVRTTPNSRPE